MTTDDKLIYPDFRRGMTDDAAPPFVEELTELVGAIERCLAELGSEPRHGAGFGTVTITPILLHLAMAEAWLEKLVEVNVATWPDVCWALRFCNARVRALNCIRASTPPSRPRGRSEESASAWEEEAAIINADALRRALRSVCDLVVTRYPRTRAGC